MVVKYNLVIFLVFLFTFVSQLHSQYEGDACEKVGLSGTCSKYRRCRSAINDFMRGKNPKYCLSMDNTPIVCCVAASSVPAIQACPPIPASALRIKKTGNKAADKCIDWGELIYPCVSSGVLIPGAPKIRNDECSHNVAPLIVGGTVAGKDEFPHMVLLGFYNPTTSDILWACGGTLISERWVMTAAHCTWLQETQTDVKYARLGSCDEGVNDPQLMHTIETIVLHPNYIAIYNYNDIALLKLDRNAKFSKSVIPACLHTGPAINNIDKFLASGWGRVASGGNRIKRLVKVTLEKFNYDECSRKNTATKRLREGVRDATQICAGHRTEAKDSCLGDSGGPLQIYNLDVYCTYKVVGIVSVGKGCGTPGQPALYTRVSAFIPWIESVVWP